MSEESPPNDPSRALQFIERNELHYLTQIPTDGRFIPELTFHDGAGFIAYIRQPDGKLMVVRPLDMMNGHYIASNPSKGEDVVDRFWEVVIRHFTFQSMPQLLLAMHSDLANALASIHRYFVLVRYSRENTDRAVTALVASELEYAFANHRAFYDLANKVLNLFRTGPHFSRTTFPGTFRKTSQRSDNELLSKYGLPESFIQFVRTRQSRFFLMRSVRDGIFHDGLSPVDIVFAFDDGFGIRIQSDFARKLDELDLWKTESLKPNGIASLLPILAFIASDIWSGLSELAERMASIEPCPPSIIGDMHVYYRSPFTAHLGRLSEYQDQQWFKPEDVLPPGRSPSPAN